MFVMYAIANCDTVKKARDFLCKQQVAYTFIDFKKTPPSVEQLLAWSQFAGELPVNKKGMTYRTHKEHYEALSTDGKIEFIRANTSIIKRPVLEQNGHIVALGFAEEHYKEVIK